MKKLSILLLTLLLIATTLTGCITLKPDGDGSPNSFKYEHQRSTIRL